MIQSLLKKRGWGLLLLAIILLVVGAVTLDADPTKKPTSLLWEFRNGLTVSGGTLSLVAGSITSAHILDATISSADIANGGVNSLNIANESIVSADIDDGTIATSDLATGAVTFAAQAHVTIGASPAATCTAGQIHIDTDETADTNCSTTADNSLCLCIATDTWTALENN